MKRVLQTFFLCSQRCPLSEFSLTQDAMKTSSVERKCQEISVSRSSRFQKLDQRLPKLGLLINVRIINKKTKYYIQAKGRPPTSLKWPQWYFVARQPPGTAASVYSSPGAQWGCGKVGLEEGPCSSHWLACAGSKPREGSPRSPNTKQERECSKCSILGYQGHLQPSRTFLVSKRSQKSTE